jgi:hypothetical protein
MMAMTSNKQILINEIKAVLKEAVRVNFKNHTFILKLDVNEDPTKKGIKVQFIPTTFGKLTPSQQNDIAMSLNDKLDAGLKPYGMSVERDRELRDKSILGFFIYLDQIDRIIRTALAGQPQEAPTA